MTIDELVRTINELIEEYKSLARRQDEIWNEFEKVEAQMMLFIPEPLRPVVQIKRPVLFDYLLEREQDEQD